MTSQPQKNALTAVKHPQGDLFICDVADAALKNFMDGMEHPLYCLSKKPETKTRRYENARGDWLEIVPSNKGMATIYDQDILIYCISQLMRAKAEGRPLSRTVRITARDLLIFTNRGTGGKDYQALCDALDRLDGTRLRTNIRRGGEEHWNAFGMVQAAGAARKFGMDGRLLYCAVTLSEWLFQAVQQGLVLTLHPDYFRLRRPIERRLYDMARKHCGRNQQWLIGMEKLHHQSGSKSPLKKFRFLVKDIATSDHLPDFHVAYDQEKDQVKFTRKADSQLVKQIDKTPTTAGKFALRTETYEEARQVALGWDVYALESEWREWLKGKTMPRNPDRAFLRFCQSYAEKRSL